MKVVLYGAKGKAGSRILRELQSRNHQVVTPGREIDDLTDVAKTSAIIQGADAVISAYAPPVENTGQLVAVTRHFVDAIESADVPRFLMVGGAGGLEVAPGVSLADSGHLPPEWLPISHSHIEALTLLQKSGIDWTYLAPAAYFEPGTRTGKFRIGSDKLISDAAGESRISMEDYAIAMVDELESGKHRQQRFCVGY